MEKYHLPKKRQTFNSGLLSIYGVTDISEPGERPEKGLYPLRLNIRYHERTVGIQRFWTGMSQDQKITMVCRVPKFKDVQSGDVVHIAGDKQYVIKQVQYIEDTQPQVMDLSLELLTKSSVIGREP